MKFFGIFKKYLSTTTLVIAGTALAVADETTTETESETAVASVIFTEGILDTGDYTLSEDGSSLVIEDSAALTMNSAGTTAVSGTVESSFVVSGGGTVSSADDATLSGIYIGGPTFAADQTNVSVTVTGAGSSVELAANTVNIGYVRTVYSDSAVADVDFTVSDGATVCLSANNLLHIGYDDSSSSCTLDTTVSVSGSGSSFSLTSSSNAYIGGGGSSNVILLAEEGATLTISSASSLYVAEDSVGGVNVDISARSGGSITISSAEYLNVGTGTGKTETDDDEPVRVTLSASGEGSSLTLTSVSTDGLWFGSSWYATDVSASLFVSDGAAATLKSPYVILGEQDVEETTGAVDFDISVTGAGSSLMVISEEENGAICFGYTASDTAAAELSASLSVSDGASATMSADYVVLGLQSSTSSTTAPDVDVSVTGAGSKLTFEGEVVVASLYFGSGSPNSSITVSNGATFETTVTSTMLCNITLTVGNDSDFSGNNATWSASGKILIDDETASATVSSGGTFSGESDAEIAAGTLTIAGGELAGTLSVAGGTVALSDGATVSGAVSIVVCENYLISSASSASARSSALISTVPVNDVFSESIVYFETILDSLISSTTGASNTVAVSSSDGSITFADTATVTISADVDYVQTLVDDLVAGTAVEYNFQLFDAAAIAALAEAGVTVELDEIWDTFTGVEATLSLSTGVLTLALAIPEPSSFTLLAGTFALALAASRRRRSRKAA